MKSRNSLIASLIAGLTLGASAVQAQVTDVVADLKAASPFPYVIDQRGVVARSGTGLCWRTGYWTPALAEEAKVVGSEFPAGCSCDKDLMPKAKCEPKAAPAQVTPPPPTVVTPKPAAQKVTLSADALFDFDKAVLRPEGKAKLDELAAKSKALKIEVILAVGHTDRIGTDAYNQKLSEKRAAAVKDYLVGKGIESNRVYSEGKGEKQPVTGDTCKKMGAENGKNKKLVACLQPDRRVDIEVIGTK